MTVLEALRQVAASIKQWVDENKVQKVSGKGLSTNDYTVADKNKVASIPNDLIVFDGKLYLAQDGVPLEDSAVTLPEGGGGGSSAVVTLKNLLDSTEITTSVGGSAILKFHFESSEDVNGGTAYIYINENLKGTEKIVTGENSIDIGAYVTEGTNNVKITCSDIYSNSKSLNYVVNAISLRITSTFDDSQIYTGDINVRYTPFGAIEKNIMFVVDGTEHVVTTSETGKQRTYTIPAMSHGTHTLVIYISAEIAGIPIKSNELKYEIMSVESNITTPLISSVYTTTQVTQGELINIPYTLYDPLNPTVDVSLVIKQNNEVFSSIQRTIDRTRQTWSTRNYPLGEVSFTITYGSINKTHTVTVVENNIDVKVKDTDLEFYLKSAGKSNEDSDRNIWSSGNVTTTFSNLNWSSTGWIDDENGDTALRLSGDAMATINFQPFLTDARATGRTIELIFAIRDVNNREAIGISCFDGKIGFTVTADTAKLMSEQSQIMCNYSDEGKVHVAFVVEPKNEMRLVSVYLNGVLSGTKQYSETDNFQQQNPISITVGSQYCSVDLYAVRSYNTFLTSAEIRDNYIADITDIGKRLAVYTDNDIYDVFGNLSFADLKSKIPVLVITGELPQSKGDKKNVSVSYTDPFNAIYNYEDTASIDVQGTSSQWSNLATVLRN